MRLKRARLILCAALVLPIIGMISLNGSAAGGDSLAILTTTTTTTTQPKPSAPTAAPNVGCIPNKCIFGTPEGVVHDGYRYQSSTYPGATGSVGWWEHVSEQVTDAYFVAWLCNGTIPYDDSECGPASAVHRVPAPPPPPDEQKHGGDEFQATGSVNGYPCGGLLPPCYVLKRESGGNPTAQNPTSSASGLWQFIDSTWAGYGGYSKAKYAPPYIQNKKAAALWNRGAGCSHWSAC